MLFSIRNPSADPQIHCEKNKALIWTCFAGGGNSDTEGNKQIIWSYFNVQSALLVARVCVLCSTDNLDADVLNVITSLITWNGDGFQQVKAFVDDSKKENIIIWPRHTDQVIFFQEML